ncbi:MAG: c-type cytochrome [Gammaproteobacteria bacterium]|nr:c-type cytochrome [Gammaproteobacteria bacterium]
MYVSMMKFARHMIIPASILCSSMVMAADKQAGKHLVMHGNDRGATACLACHGLNGEGNAATAFPRLAGLNATYLAKQLHDFKNDTRLNSIMQPIAKALNDREIENAAAYFASLKPPAASGHADDSQADDGKALVELGAWDETVPACVQCHGPGARGVGTTFPPLAGQHASYLVAQLNDWKEGRRKNDPLHLMHGIASRLGEGQIKAVAAYLSTLKPVH